MSRGVCLAGRMFSFWADGDVLIRGAEELIIFVVEKAGM